MTPSARLLVNNTITTVSIMTNASERGAFCINLNDCQLNVPTETITMMPAKIGIGISTTQSPKTIIKMIKNTQAVKLERREADPEHKAITHSPIIAKQHIEQNT